MHNCNLTKILNSSLLLHTSTMAADTSIGSPWQCIYIWMDPSWPVVGLEIEFLKMFIPIRFSVLQGDYPTTGNLSDTSPYSQSLYRTVCCSSRNYSAFSFWKCWNTFQNNCRWKRHLPISALCHCLHSGWSHHPETLCRYLHHHHRSLPSSECETVNGIVHQLP